MKAILLLVSFTFSLISYAYSQAPPTPSPLDGSRKAAIQKKLSTIIVPKVEFDETLLHEAIDFLRLRCFEGDLATVEPSKKGINFVITQPPSFNPHPIKQIRLYNVPAAILLQHIADQVSMKVVIKEFFVELVPLGSAEAPELDAEFNGATSAAANIIIARMDFENTRLDEAIDFLNTKSNELTKGKNIPIVILDPTADKAAFIHELRVRSVSVLALVSYIASVTDHQVIIEENTLRLTKR